VNVSFLKERFWGKSTHPKTLLEKDPEMDGNGSETKQPLKWDDNGEACCETSELTLWRL